MLNSKSFHLALRSRNENNVHKVMQSLSLHANLLEGRVGNALELRNVFSSRSLKLVNDFKHLFKQEIRVEAFVNYRHVELFCKS